MKQKKEYKIIFFILIYLSVNIVSFSIKLSSTEGLNRLSNYNEIKNIEVEKIVSREELERKNGLVYEKNKNTVFNGALVARKNGKEILGIYIYRYGKTEDYGYDYYDNGQLEIEVKQKNDKSDGEGIEYYENGKLKSKRYYRAGILEKITEYRQNGTTFRMYQAIEGINGIRTVYYENGKSVKSIAEVTQNRQKEITNYILNGKLKIYDKQGRLQAILNFKNDSIAGLPQEMYYPNGKLKYYAIAKDNNQKNPTFTEKAISYYDNGQEKENCDEVDRGMWMCKKYDKNGKFKGEAQKGGQPIETSNFWANFFMGVLNILLQ
jgi:hypothetical protein prD11_05111